MLPVACGQVSWSEEGDFCKTFFFLSKNFMKLGLENTVDFMMQSRAWKCLIYVRAASTASRRRPRPRGPGSSPLRALYQALCLGEREHVF